MGRMRWTGRGGEWDGEGVGDEEEVGRGETLRTLLQIMNGCPLECPGESHT